MKITRGIALAAAAAMSLTTLAACGSDTAQDEETPDSLSFWYYEEDDAGQTQAWRRAAEAFEKKRGVKIISNAVVHADRAERQPIPQFR